jgi:hypothetical protein
MLESDTEIEPYAVSVVSAEVDPVMFKLDTVAGDTFFVHPASKHVAASLWPSIRGPGVPLFLQNLSFLI